MTTGGGMVAPGSVIGIFGGGQLGRMLAMAAARLGYRIHIYAPESDTPAADVAAHVTRASYDDRQALADFARRADILTYEFENVAVGAMWQVGRDRPLHPGAHVLDICQDRLMEKRFFEKSGGRVAPYHPVDSPDDLEPALRHVGGRGRLKTRRFGYDGKGQMRVEGPGTILDAWDALGRSPCILEGEVDFLGEFSIILARGIDGTCRLYPPARNVHDKGILVQSCVPITADWYHQLEAAAGLTRRIADALDYVGVLAVEFFACADGPRVNEMAPRVHNSGHWTIEGAVTSQFENHIRAICGLPLGATDLVGDTVCMDNLLGDAVQDWPRLLCDPTAHLHLYGKGEIRPGRKMGHVTRISFDTGG